MSPAPSAAGCSAPAARCSPAAELLVPVPLHWTRLFRRRYNQAALAGARDPRRRRPAGRGRLPGSPPPHAVAGSSRARWRASATCAARFACAARPQCRRQAGRPRRRRDDDRGDGRRMRARAEARRGGVGRRADAGAGIAGRGIIGRRIAERRSAERTAAMAEVEMYTTMFCPYCARARALLAEEGRRLRRDRHRRGAGAPRRDDPSAPAGAARCRRSLSTASISAAATTSWRSTAPASSTRSWASRDERRLSPPPASSSPRRATTSPISATVSDLVRRARDAGADFVMTPGEHRADRADRQVAAREGARRGEPSGARGAARCRARDRGVAADRLARGRHLARARHTGGRAPARQPLVS